MVADLPLITIIAKKSSQSFWEMIGDWGEPANIIALAGLLIVVIGGILGWLGKRRSDARSQAESVTAWVDKLEDGSFCVLLSNSSSEQVNDVFLVVTRDDDYEETSDHQVRQQSMIVGSVPPNRTVKFRVDLSRLPRDVLPKCDMVFRDARDRVWRRDPRGRLTRHSDEGLAAKYFASSVVDAWTAEVVNVDNEDVEIPIIPFSNMLSTRARGNQLIIQLLPTDRQISIHSEGKFSTSGALRVTTYFDQDGRLIKIDLHNVVPEGPSQRDQLISLGTSRRMDYLPERDWLIVKFGAFAQDEDAPDKLEVVPLTDMVGADLGEILYDDAYIPFAIRIVDAHRRLHPAFWESAPEEYKPR